MVAGVEPEVRDLPDRPGSPGIKLIVKLGGREPQLGRGNCEPVDLLDHGRDVPGVRTLRGYLGQGLGSSRTRGRGVRYSVPKSSYPRSRKPQPSHYHPSK